MAFSQGSQAGSQVSHNCYFMEGISLNPTPLITAAGKVLVLSGCADRMRVTMLISSSYGFSVWAWYIEILKLRNYQGRSSHRRRGRRAAVDVPTI